jgi:hypothetical protein
MNYFRSRRVCPSDDKHGVFSHQGELQLLIGIGVVCYCFIVIHGGRCCSQHEYGVHKMEMPHFFLCVFSLFITFVMAS